MESHAISVADTMIATLKHAMAVHDRQMVNFAIENTTSMSQIVSVKLIDKSYIIQADSTESDVGLKLDTQGTGCIECHRSDQDRPRAISLGPEQDGILRIATPIENEPECQSCHTAADENLGILLIDVSQYE